MKCFIPIRCNDKTIRMVIQLFGIAKEIIGDKQLVVKDTDSLTTVFGLKQWLSQKYTSLQTLQSWAIAVDAEYADDTKTINKESELALIPPVSGG